MLGKEADKHVENVPASGEERGRLRFEPFYKYSYWVDLMRKGKRKERK